MRSMFSQIKNRRQAANGFTLIEVLVVAPIVMLVIGGFVALIVSMVGDTLISRDRNALNYDTQNALDTIERDVKLSTQFLVTSKTLSSPQGSNSNFTGTSAFTSTDSLILSSLATTDSPLDSTRALIYYAMQPNACGGAKTENRLFLTKTIYFVNNGSLWRRTIVPTNNLNATPDDYTVCDVPWQQNSCSLGYVAPLCKTNDVELMTGVQTFSVKYFDTPGGTTDLGPSNALNATTIEVTINGKKTIAGEDVTVARSLRTTKLNSIDPELPLPNSPKVTAKLDSANRVSASWNPVPGATAYVVTYTVNGGGGGTSTVTGTTFSIATDYYRKDTLSFSVLAKNVTGTSLSPGTAAITIPEWTRCDLQNSWVDYTDGYPTPGYTKTSAQLVMLKGLIKNGSTTQFSAICQLPVGYRPAYPLVFNAMTATGIGRVDIGTDGTVLYIAGSNAWFNLNSIMFYPSSTYSWTNLTSFNGWSNYSSGPGGYAPMQVTKDSIGRAYIQGIAARGSASYADNTKAYEVPNTYQPQYYQHFLTESGPQLYSLLGMDSSRSVYTKGQAMDYWSLQVMYYPTAVSTGWTGLSMANGWGTYPGFSPPQYRKAADGVVTLRGLLNKGSPAAFGETIATLPVGYRPKERIIFATPSCCGISRVDIATDGTIIKLDGDSSIWQSFDGMNFMAEQ